MASTDRTASIGAVLAQVADLRGNVARRSVKDIVAEKIALLIAAGVLRPGDRLPAERDLAGAFGVSRESLRGALQVLSGRGVLEVNHGAPTRVLSAAVGGMVAGVPRDRALDGYDLEEVHQARLQVELQVVADAASGIDDATIARLEASLEEQARAFDDPLRFLICNHDFHATIYRAAGNRLLADFVADLDTHVMEYRRRVMMQPGAIACSYRDHVAIVEALIRRDRTGAVAAFRAHVERIHTTTRALMESERREEDEARLARLEDRPS